MSDDMPETGEPLEPDAIYRQVGLFIVAFQSLENELMQICWLTTDPPNSPDGRRALADLSFSKLVTESGNRVDAFLIRRGLDDSDFRRKFHELLQHCRTIAKLRNQIVHSAYVHPEGGGELRAIVRSDMTKASDSYDVDFDQELITAMSFDAALQDMASTVFQLAQSRVQLIHWLP
jgi:hypothetical protein